MRSASSWRPKFRGTSPTEFRRTPCTRSSQNGGLLSGTDKPDHLDGKKGEDEIHGLGAKDELIGGLGSDVIYGGPGDDFLKGNTLRGATVTGKRRAPRG
jgi:Ca2+-binding RTX toxin-like protein